MGFDAPLNEVKTTPWVVENVRSQSRPLRHHSIFLFRNSCRGDHTCLPHMHTVAVISGTFSDHSLMPYEYTC